MLWALIPWFPESGENLVHPSDLGRIHDFKPYGVVFYVGERVGEYIWISSGENSFRVSEDFIREVKPEVDWLYKIGEVVSIKGTGTIGQIESIHWHFAKEKPIFHLKIDGKLKSKRYWPEDIEKI